jgi:hypothetical protein
LVARVSAGTLLAAAVIGWNTYLSTTCGGADSYGYVSAGQRILAGRLIQPEPLAAVLPFPNGIDAASPLGYVASPTTLNASIPMYPLGLPALMAVATLLFGRNGPFVVAPLMGVVLLAGAYWIALSWYRERILALLAAALVALNPLVFTYSIQPMSDVPAAAALLLAVAALCHTPSRPWLAGAAAAGAVLMRPALAPAAVALAVVAFHAASREHSPHAVRLSSTVRYLAPVGCGIALQAALQWYLYGSVFTSGYGGVASLFSLERLAINLRSYGYWAFFALGPVTVSAFAIGLATSTRLPRLVTALTAASVGLPYAFYRTYDHWETLRFLLPAIAIAMIPAAAGLVFASRRGMGPRAGSVVAVAVAAAIALTWMSWLRSNDVFAMPQHEVRHRLAGEMVMRATPADAVVLSLQHSGSLRYYAERQTVNWDRIPSGALGASVKSLQDHGLAVFLLIDSDAERTIFDKRHGSDLAGWLPAAQRRDMQLLEAR